MKCAERQVSAPPDNSATGEPFQQCIGKILRLSPTSAIAYGPNLAPLLSALDVTRRIDLPRPGFHPLHPGRGFFSCVLICQFERPN